MQLLNFPIIDPHIHQWDSYNTLHPALGLVKVIVNYPSLMDKMVA